MRGKKEDIKMDKEIMNQFWATYKQFKIFQLGDSYIAGLETDGEFKKLLELLEG